MLFNKLAENRIQDLGVYHLCEMNFYCRLVSWLSHSQKTSYGEYAEQTNKPSSKPQSQTVFKKLIFLYFVVYVQNYCLKAYYKTSLNYSSGSDKMIWLSLPLVFQDQFYDPKCVRFSLIN